MANGEFPEVDVEVMMEEVRKRVRGGAGPVLSASMQERAADLSLLRSGFDVSQVTFTSHRRLLGPAVVLTKRILRRVLTPILERQTAYNVTAGRVLTNLSDYAETMGHQTAALGLEVDKLRQRKAELETELQKVHQQQEAMEQGQTQLRDSLAAQLQTAMEQGQTQLRDSLAVERENVNQLVDSLLGRLKILEGIVGQGGDRHPALLRDLTPLRDRIARAERKLRRILHFLVDGGGADVPTTPHPKLPREALEAEFDYAGFEERYRGSEEEIKERQRTYVDLLRDAEQVFDIGCGRGEFLELLSEAKIRATGVDNDLDMVLLCREKGLTVEHQDAFTYLESLPDASVGGIFSAQLIEHLPSEQIITFVRLCHLKLRPGGVIVLETPNPQCLSVFARGFYMDFSHVWPCHPEAMRYLLETVGFEEIRLLFSSPVDTSLSIPLLSDTHVFGADTDRFNRTATFLNELLLGPQDYAVVGRRRGWDH